MNELPQVLERKEDSFAWYSRVSSETHPSPLLKSLDTKKTGIQLVFPKSEKIFTRLRKPENNRLMKHEWPLQKTLFLDVPFLMTFINLNPAQAGAWIIDAQKENKYYEIVVFSRAYISQASPIELEDTIMHEADHLNEYRSKLTIGTLPHGSGATDEKVQEISAEEEFERNNTRQALIARYGPVKVQHELDTADRKLIMDMFKKPILMSVVAELWLGKFCSSQSSNLNDVEFDMPVSMQGGELSKAWDDIEERSTALYRHFVGINLSKLI